MMRSINRMMGMPAVLCLCGIWISACTSLPSSGATPTQESPQPQGQPEGIQVPYGSAPELDGNFAPGEWAPAIRFELSAGGWVQFVQDGEFLYVGIRSDSLGYGSLCWERDGQVWILHSSAALGSAVFQWDGEAWRPIQDYDWCCRSQVDLNQRESLLESQGWMASIGYLGDPTEMEYQIAWDSRMQLAVVYQTGPSLDTASHWPSEVTDSCLDLTIGSGELPDPAHFDLDSWGLLVQNDH